MKRYFFWGMTALANFKRAFLVAGVMVCVHLGLSPAVWAATYANVAVPFAWVDASTHTKLGPTLGGVYSASYRFQNPGGCGTAPPIIDDTISDNIPIGFTFMFGGVNFTHVRIMSNGRLQFNNNTTCGYGSPVTQLPYPNTGLDYTMRVYGGDLDPSLQSEIGGAYTTSCTSRSNCYVSYATLGTAPNRRFVVTWNNVPEWTTFTYTSGNYNLQVILQENGEFIYQYGNSTPGPGHTVGQIGWQVSAADADYDVPQVGFPPAGTAIKFYIPQPVAEYRMEQPSWSGTAGEVLDTSGNGRHATAVVSGSTIRPQTVAGGKVCRGGQIADNNTTAEISAIDTTIAIPTTVGSSGTISFWYNNSSNDRMLFDASVTANRWFYLQRTNNRALSFVVTDSGNVNRTATTANNILPNNGWSHIVVSWTFNNLAGSNQDRLRIWVDGVLQATTAFTTTNTVSPQIGTLYIGDNRSSISPVGRSAGNPGGGGNASLDEFRIYNFEGGLALVQRDMNQITACLAHYAIAHAGSGQACQSQNVTITAHDASHNPIIMPNNTTTIVLSTSTGQGDWSLVSGWGTFSNGTAGDGIATYLWNGEYQAVFALNHPAAGTVNINVTDGQIAESATEDPPLVLNACFSKFNACHNYTGSNCSAANGRLYTRLAGVGFDTDVVALTDTDTVATSFTGKAQVSVIARASPGGPVDAQNCFTPDYTLFLDNATTSFTSGRLNLTNQVVPQAYRDVRIKVTCDATHCPPSGMTWCSTDNFAIRPQGFAVSAKLGEQPVEQLKAGHGFTLEANSNVSAQYTGTPALDTSRLRDHNNNPAGSITGAFSAGTGAVASGTFQYHDVGTLSLLADAVTDATFTSVDQPSDCVSGSTSNTLSAGKYGCVIGSAAAGPFGRFYPDHFTFAATLTPACSSGFSYMDQPALGINLAMTARSSNGAVTTRYTAGYPYLGTFSITGDNGGTPVSLSRLDPALPPFVWNNGSYTVNVTNTKFTRGSSPDGPYENFALKANILSEPDGVALSGGALSNTTRIRYGRIKLGNAHGSELLPLPIPFSLEYYNAGSWTKNLLDTCTSITASSFALAFPPAPSNHLAACETAMAITGSAPGFQPKLFAPGAGNDGWTDVTLNLGATASGSACMAQGASAVPATTVNAPWLQYPGNSNPTSRATFGLYKNANELIYLRENY